MPSISWSAKGGIEIRCRVFIDALLRQAGAAEITRKRAVRLLRWYRQRIERIAFARYAAGDLRDGVVAIEHEDISIAADRYG